MTDPIDTIDAWAKARCDKLTAECEALVMAGKSFPEHKLGQSQAYMALRSFIKGMRKHD